MLESSARRPCAPELVSAAMGLILVFALTGCAEEKKAAPPEPSPTPIASLNTSALQIPRIEFCPLISKSAVAEALGGEAASEAAYGNGEEQKLTGLGTDVVHEIGCSWTGQDGTTARAWVFARPVSPAFALTVIDDARNLKGCSSVAGSRYGTPSTVQQCTLSTGEKRVRYAGLFGQTWLTCELASVAVEQAELRSRTEQWCVEAANALNTAG